MYLKIYSIGGMNRDELFPNFDNIRILRFSFNNFTDNNNVYSDDMIYKNVTKLFEELVTLMQGEYKKCFNNIYPWNSKLKSNEEHIIVYNFITLRVLGWCSVDYSRVNTTDGKYYYTGFINKLVTLSQSQYKDDNKIIKENFPTNIGKLILVFIYNIINYPINLLITLRKDGKTIDQNMNVHIQYLYLYSLTSSISYYKNNIDFFHQFSNKDKDKIYDDNYLTTTTYEEQIYDHVFFAFNNHIITSKNRDLLSEIHNKLKELHQFEINSIMIQATMRQYKDFIPPEDCYKIEKFTISNDILKQNKNINIFPATGFILSKSNTQSAHSFRRSSSAKRQRI